MITREKIMDMVVLCLKRSMDISTKAINAICVVMQTKSCFQGVYKKDTYSRLDFYNMLMYFMNEYDKNGKDSIHNLDYHGSIINILGMILSFEIYENK